MIKIVIHVRLHEQSPNLFMLCTNIFSRKNSGISYLLSDSHLEVSWNIHPVELENFESDHWFDILVFGLLEHWKFHLMYKN